jgi:iron complex outermembrane recepter protein
MHISHIVPFQGSRLLAVVLLGLPLWASSQEASNQGEPVELEGMVVTATRSEERKNRLPAGVTVIPQEEIARSGARHVVDVLRNRGGIQVTDSFGDGSRTLVGIRGFGENAHSNTLILVDGRRLSNPDIAGSDLNSIALKDIERIEIIEGSAGALYGDQAVGGVINIITRRPETYAATTEITIGSYGARAINAFASDRPTEALSYRLSAEVRQSDNYRDHNAIDYRNVLGRADYSLGAGNLFVEMDLIREELETPGALFKSEMDQDRRQSSANFRGDFSDTDTDIVRMGVSHPLSAHWTLAGELTQRSSDGVFRLSSVFGPETQDATQDRKIVGLTPRLIGRHPLAQGDMLLTMGIDAQDADYELVSRFGEQRNAQEIRDIYAQGIIPLAPGVDVTLGARRSKVDNELEDTGAFAIYPNGQKVDDSVTATQLGLTYRPDRFVRTFIRHDENFRFAKVDEYFASGATAGTVLLKTQTGKSTEIGAEWNDGYWRIKGVVYRLELDEEIAFDPTTFNNINIEGTRRNGLLLETGGEIVKDLELIASYHYVDAEVETGAFKGNSIPLVSRQNARLALNYRFDDYLALFIEALGTDQRAFSGDFDNTLGKLPGYGLLNLGARYQLGRWRFQGRFNNVLNKEYSEFGASGLDPGTFSEVESFFPSPERNGTLTLAYDF